MPVRVKNQSTPPDPHLGDAPYTLWYAGDHDSDGDGIPVLIDQNGFYDGNGNFSQTVPNNADTDGGGQTRPICISCATPSDIVENFLPDSFA